MLNPSDLRTIRIALEFHQGALVDILTQCKEIGVVKIAPLQNSIDSVNRVMEKLKDMEVENEDSQTEL